MREKKLRDLSLNDIVELLKQNGLQLKVFNLGYSGTKWFIKFKNHPIPSIAYRMDSHKIVIVSHMIEVPKYPTLRGLRKNFPCHMLTLYKYNQGDDLYIVLRANIKDTYTTEFLIDTLNAAKYFVDNLTK